MRVHYRCCRSARFTVYEQTGPPDFCCQEMQTEWGILISFGLKGHPRTSSREVNLFGLHQFSTGTIIPVITDIRYCPWCGEEIKVVRVLGVKSATAIRQHQKTDRRQTSSVRSKEDDQSCTH